MEAHQLQPDREGWTQNNIQGRAKAPQKVPWETKTSWLKITDLVRPFTDRMYRRQINTQPVTINDKLLNSRASQNYVIHITMIVAGDPCAPPANSH